MQLPISSEHPTGSGRAPVTLVSTLRIRTVDAGTIARKRAGVFENEQIETPTIAAISKVAVRKRATDARKRTTSSTLDLCSLSSKNTLSSRGAALTLRR
jgi:hypothetical protein